MTTEVLNPAPPYVIAGSGPYGIPHPYQWAGDLVVEVRSGSVSAQLEFGVDYAVFPAASLEVGGDLTLVETAFEAYAGWTLTIVRDTTIEQGWQGLSGPREKGLERQLDRLTQALQDQTEAVERAIKLPRGSAFDRTFTPPGAGRALIVNPTGTAFTAGPTAGEIASAEAFALAALAARDQAAGFAAEIISQGAVPIFASTTGVAGVVIPAPMISIRTNGYAADGDGGGAVFTRAASATVGGITDQTGAHFKRVANRADVRAFGAKGDNVTDDRLAVQAAGDFAMASEVPLYFPFGRYLIDSAISVNNAILIKGDKSASVICEGEIILGAGIAGTISSGRAIRFETDSNPAAQLPSLIWRGGRVDLSALPANTTGVDGISLGPRYGTVAFYDLTVDCGVTTPVGANIGSGGGDSGIFVKECESFIAQNVHVIGAQDLGIYLSGDNDLARVGRDARIVSCEFTRCGGGIGAKRYFRNCTITGNTFRECSSGILFGNTDGIDNQGMGGIIGFNTFERMQNVPLNIENSDDLIIIGNRATDWRRWISDGVTATNASTSNIGGGIRLAGCKRCTVVGNVVAFKDWAPVTAAPEACGVALIGYVGTEGTVTTEDCTVMGNVIKGCSRALVVSSSAPNNVLAPNRYSGNLVADSIAGANCGMLPMVGAGATGLNWLASNVVAMMIDGLEVMRFSNSAGTPLLRLGAHTAQAGGTITGFISIQDLNGVTRKLAVLA